MASRFLTRTMSPPGGMQHSWHADDGGDGDLPPSPPQPPQQHQQFPFQPPSPTLPPQHDPQHEQEQDESYLPPHPHPPSTPPPRSRWADSSSPPAHSNRSSAFDPDNVMSSDDGAEPYEDEQQQQQPPLLQSPQHQAYIDLPSPVPSYLPPFPPAAKFAASHEEHKELAEERYAESFNEHPRVEYAAPPRVAPSARAPAVSHLIAGEERESAELSDGWDAEETEGEYSSAPQAAQQRIRRKPPNSALEASTEAAAALFANPHVQSALSAAQSGYAYTRSTLESGMDLAGQRSSEFMEKVMPVIVATAQSAAAVSAETLSGSVMPSVSAAVHSTYDQVSMSVVPGVVQQAKAVQRWLAQRVHLSTPVHPAQLMSAGSSSSGAADTGKEDLSSYIAMIEAALKKSEEQDEQASRVLDHGSPRSAASGSAPGSADSNASYLSGQSVLVIEDHFDKITEKEKTKLTMFLAEMKRVRNQQLAGMERSRGNSVDLKHAAPPQQQQSQQLASQQQQSPQLQSFPLQQQHRRDDSEGERKSSQPQPSLQQQQQQHPRSQAPASSSSRHPKSSSRRPSTQQQQPSQQPRHSVPHPFPDLLSAPFPPTDLDVSAEPIADPFLASEPISRTQQPQQPQPQLHDRRDSFPDLLSAPFAPSADLPDHAEIAVSLPNSVFNQRWPNEPEDEHSIEVTPHLQPPPPPAALSAPLHPHSIFSAISHPQQHPPPQLSHPHHSQHRQHRQPPPPPSHHMQSAEEELQRQLEDDE